MCAVCDIRNFWFSWYRWYTKSGRGWGVILVCVIWRGRGDFGMCGIRGYLPFGLGVEMDKGTIVTQSTTVR